MNNTRTRITHEPTVSDLGEDGLIEHLCTKLTLPDDVLVGPGDDCAVVCRGGEELTLLKTDAVVEGIHYLAIEKLMRVGWKAVARVMSDFAAMGGRPSEFLITIALPKDTPVARVARLYQGMQHCLDTHGGAIVGGETTSLPDGSPMMISVAGRGQVSREHLVTRAGGKAGDGIYVTGRLGGSHMGKHLDFTPRLEEAAWLVQNYKPNAMMDLSDGIIKDLPRLARMSECGFELKEEQIIRTPGVTIESALNYGEDYELLFTRGDDDGMMEAWSTKFPELPLTRVGSLVEGSGDSLDGGWDHFRQP